MVTWNHDSPSFVDRDACDMHTWAYLQILPTGVHELLANSHTMQRLHDGLRPQQMEAQSNIYPQPMLLDSHVIVYRTLGNDASIF
jgi:hypothetical protein